jgi:hypothetical protein
MQLSPAQAVKLLRLERGESLPKSQLPSAVLEALRAGDAVVYEKSGAGTSIRGVPGAVAKLVEYRWGIRDLDKYSRITIENRNRAELSQIAGDSKALPTNPLRGIILRCLGDCFVGAEPLGWNPEGSSTLITLNRLPALRVTTPTIVAVENVDNLHGFEHMLPSFPQLQNLRYTLALRWNWGAAWRNWLTGWNGRLLYLPDYDPAGLRIFITEVLPFRESAELLIPQDFDALLKRFGRRDLFLKQEHLLPVAHPNEQVHWLVAALRKSRKGLEQEQLLRSPPG